MISDVFSEAVSDVREYLDNPLFDEVYAGDLRGEIVRVVDEMERIRLVVDTHPAVDR